MFNKVKTMINQGPFTVLETELNKVIRNQNFIKASSMQMNFILWLQKSSKWQREFVLKQMQIPTEDKMKSLYASLNRLEEENDDLRADILSLQKELKSLKAVPAKTSRTRKTVQ